MIIAGSQYSHRCTSLLACMPKKVPHLHTREA